MVQMSRREAAQNGLSECFLGAAVVRRPLRISEERDRAEEARAERIAEREEERAMRWIMTH